MNKATLIEEIEKGKQVFDSLIKNIGKDDLVQSGACGDWSVKDIVAHIVVHEQRMLKWMDETLKGETPSEHQPYDSPDELLNALNQQIFLENKDRVWQEILNEWESTHEKTLVWTKSVSEQDLFDPTRFCLQDGEPLWLAVAANTYEHCEEHGRDIHAWMGRTECRPHSQIPLAPKKRGS